MYFCLFLIAGTNVYGIGQGGEGWGAQTGAFEQRFGSSDKSRGCAIR
jgi:hypothetical protein